MSFKVIVPGALTTVQDLGRYGHQQSGMPCSGVMDQQSFFTANELLGNSPDAAVLEHTLFGGGYQFISDTVIALTGADMAPTVNGSPCPMYRPVLIPAGSILMLGLAKHGCRTYLAVSGGIDVPSVLGSRSTNLKCRIGGFEGRALQAGDILQTGPGVLSYEELSGRTAPQPVFSSDITVHVIEGPQADYFTEHGLQTFYTEPYTVSDQNDRMGCRMEGPAVESIRGTDIISDGIVFGSVQVTSAGQPIILMADRQTTGGYAKIATVCSADLPLLAQCRPGDKVHFMKKDLE